MLFSQRDKGPLKGDSTFDFFSAQYSIISSSHHKNTAIFETAKTFFTEKKLTTSLLCF
ncbi:hypothetical protein HYC85_009241 [Camellia sinensis]|uniref:Uncharacterized protein n=1 Tax=Camellia sinensis TaxID=4442 RepID=A0A7J7HFN5_CAMSI|nr:hypothetical protein HYC85_009241 [Camellia sinensis]